MFARFILPCIACLFFGNSWLHSAGLALENHKTGTTVDYQVALLSGTVETGARSIQVANTSTPEKPRISEGVVHENRFKALVELIPGQNRLALKSDLSEDLVWIDLDYVESTNPYYMRLIWMTDNSGATDFATPVDDHPQEYEARMQTAALLMQTFTAERMHEAGYGRRTFRLERDAAGKVIVHTLKTPQSAEDYALLTGNQWWGQVGNWLSRDHPDKYAKNMVLAAYTRKESGTGKMINHTALGGGNLGLFGSASVFSWPRSLDEARTVFADSTMIDPARVHDDSSRRSVVWGLVSTTVGAALHEMGHTFGLPHTKDPHDIMTRGFDHFGRAFTFFDPPSRVNLRPKVFQKDEEAKWAPVSASALRWSRWFAGNDPQHPSEERPTIGFDMAAGTATLRCSAGLRWTGFISNGDAIAFREFTEPEAPVEVVLKLDEIQAMMDGLPLTRVAVLSANGAREGRDLE